VQWRSRGYLDRHASDWVHRGHSRVLSVASRAGVSLETRDKCGSGQLRLATDGTGPGERQRRRARELRAGNSASWHFIATTRSHADSPAYPPPAREGGQGAGGRRSKRQKKQEGAASSGAANGPPAAAPANALVPADALAPAAAAVTADPAAALPPLTHHSQVVAEAQQLLGLVQPSGGNAPGQAADYEHLQAALQIIISRNAAGYRT